jgi:hypothetical protein
LTVNHNNMPYPYAVPCRHKLVARASALKSLALIILSVTAT